MKKIISIFIFITVLFTNFGFTQEIPKSYERKVKREAIKVERFKKDHDIVLEPIESVPLLQTYSTDALGLENWGLDYLQVDEYRDKISSKQGKRNVLVVEFDTGGELTHPSLLKASLKGFSYTGEPLKDEHGHATHVAGIMASDFSTIGVCQVLIKSGHIKIMPAKVLHNEGWGDMPEIVTGVNDMLSYVDSYLEAGWFVIFTNSWGGSNFSDELEALYKKAEEKGILVLAASGNNGSGTISNPAASKHVEAVGALQEDGTRASYSQYGEGLAFTAPGSGIYSTYKNGSFAKLSGTSMATPHQAAVFALIASYWPDATAVELKAHFRKYTKDLPPEGYDRFTGYGASPIGDLIKNKPLPVNPDDPEDPIGDPDIIKKERRITIPLKDLEIVWGIGSFQDQRPLDIEITLNITSKRLAEITYDQTFDIANGFFGNIGIMFSDKNADVLDATEWTGKFFYRYANSKQNIYTIEVLEITATDKNGRTFTRSGSDLVLSNSTVDFDDIPVLIRLSE